MKTQLIWMTKSRHCKQCLGGNFCLSCGSASRARRPQWAADLLLCRGVANPRQRNTIPGSFPCSGVCRRVEISREMTALPSSWEWSATLWIDSPYWEITRESVTTAKRRWCSVACSAIPMLPLCCPAAFFTFLWSPGRLPAHSWQAKLWG